MDSAKLETDRAVKVALEQYEIWKEISKSKIERKTQKNAVTRTRILAKISHLIVNENHATK